LRAFEQSQQYKVGKFILEKGLITKINFRRGNPAMNAALIRVDHRRQQQQSSDKPVDG
jgi:hypothetical protein